MAVQIQFRRDTATNWSSNNPVLAIGEPGFDTTNKVMKIGDGTNTWTALPELAVITDTPVYVTEYTALGALVVGASAGATTTLTVGSNNSLLVADSVAPKGVKWASTLSGLTLTSPTINTATITSPTITGASVTGASVSAPVITNPTVSTGAFTSPAITKGLLTSPLETWSVSASAASGEVILNVNTATNWLFQGGASANFKFNVTGVGTTLGVNQSITVVAVVTNSGSYAPSTVIKIDSSVSDYAVSWQGNANPLVVNASGKDIYMFTIVKLSDAPTYAVFGSQTQYL